MRNCLVSIILLLCSLISLVSTKRWTEEDEERRIQMINDQEWKMFQSEQSSQRQREYRNQNFGREREPISFEKSVVAAQVRSSEEERTKLFVGEPAKKEEEFWCYHCASPINKISSDLRKSVRNLMDLRRTSFPKDAVTPECVTARNFTALKKQRCNYKYCQTLSIIDHNAGASFVLRGCAEYFGAVIEKEFEEKPDFSCNKLHDKLDIKECICREKEYCNAGWKRGRNVSVNNSFSAFSSFVFVIVVIFF